MKPVAFDVDDNGYGAKLFDHFGGDDVATNYVTQRNGKRLLVGTVIRISNRKKTGPGATSKIHYDIQWEESDLGDTPIEAAIVIPAIALHRTTIQSRSASRPPNRNTRNTNVLFTPELQSLLLRVDESEMGCPDSSDDEDSVNDEEQNEENFVFHPHPLFENEAKNVTVDDDEDNEEYGNTSDFCWSTGTLLPPPDRSKRRPSHVIPSRTGSFATPLSSLLAFIPLRIFNSIAAYSNLYAHNVLETSGSVNISGKRWEGDISINEMMTFFGILIKMVLRPTPGQSYPYCWNDVQWHPYTLRMRLRRFQQIRSVLHFNDNSRINGSRDAVFKVNHNKSLNIPTLCRAHTLRYCSFRLDHY